MRVPRQVQHGATTISTPPAGRRGAPIGARTRTVRLHGAGHGSARALVDRRRTTPSQYPLDRAGLPCPHHLPSRCVICPNTAREAQRGAAASHGRDDDLERLPAARGADRGGPRARSKRDISSTNNGSSVILLGRERPLPTNYLRLATPSHRSAQEPVPNAHRAHGVFPCVTSSARTVTIRPDAAAFGARGVRGRSHGGPDAGSEGPQAS